jgi:hypothetical protein
MGEILAGAAALAAAEALGAEWAMANRPWACLLVGVGWMVSGQLIAGVAMGLAGGVLMAGTHQGLGAIQARERAEVCRFWQRVALLLSAGLGLLAAVEEARPLDRLGKDLSTLALGLADGNPEAATHFVTRHPYPEARQVAGALGEAWANGLDADSVQRQAASMLEQLSQEQRLKQARAPIWSAALPGLGLLNMMLVILIPLGTALWKSWGRL